MTSEPITYRELRNTPGRVFERLAEGETLSLVSEGTTKALLIPVEEGDATTALDAWRRGRALLALSRLQGEARREGTAVLTQGAITREIRSSRRARRARETDQ